MFVCLIYLFIYFVKGNLFLWPNPINSVLIY